MVPHDASSNSAAGIRMITVRTTGDELAALIRDDREAGLHRVCEGCGNQVWIVRCTTIKGRLWHTPPRLKRRICGEVRWMERLEDGGDLQPIPRGSPL